jgi:hypothetical protein
MAHFWLTYGDATRPVGVVIMVAPSMLQARINASVRTIAGGMPFAEGHELSARLVALVPPSQIGRMLPGAEAAELLRHFGGRS